MEKRMSTTLACILYATLLWGKTATINGVTWSYTTKVDGEETIAVITGASPKSSKLTVPAKLPRSGGYPVREIAEDAFASDNDSITEVVFPESMRRIGKYAFEDCRNLERVTFNEGLVTIGHGAFDECSKLGNVTIPSTVEEEVIFPGAYLMTAITVADGNPYFKSIDGIVYSKDGSRLVFVPAGLTGEWTVPGQVTEIGDEAFVGGALSGVTIHADVSKISESAAFGWCTNLTHISVAVGNANYKDVGGILFSSDGTCLMAYPAGKKDVSTYTVPRTVTRLCDAAFGGSSLSGIILPSTVRRLPTDLFCDCTNLTSVTIPNSVTNIGHCAFENCSGLTSIAIPNSVMCIENDAFEDCTGLTSVTIPDSVTQIGEWVFDGCTGIKTVTIPQSVCSVGMNKVFPSSRTTITKVVVSANVTRIGYAAFSGFNNIRDVTVPQSVLDAGPNQVFNRYSSITNVSYSSNVTNISSDAFWGWSGLTSVTIPNNVKSIGARAFNYCSNLKSVTIGDGVLSVGDYAFESCSKLVDVTIPNSVTSIGECAFWRCSGLTSVTILGSVKNFGYKAFGDCSKLASVTIGHGVKEIGNYAFSGCSGLTSVTIPDSVTTIGFCAFWGCSGLENVTFLGEVPEGVSSSYILSNASSVRYPKKYASMYEQFVPSSQFGGYVGVEDFLNFHGEFVNDETKPWDDDCSVSHDRQASMRSGNIGNNESTWIELTVNGTGRLSFWWKASSEEYNGDVFDYAYLSVDGVPQGTLDGNYRLNGIAIGGKTDWTNVVVHIAGDGSHTVRWTYCKDDMDESDVGEDCVWLDEVSFAPLVSLSYSLGGGEGIGPAPAQYYAGTPLTLPTGDGLIKPKHHFAGWSDGTNTYDAEAEYVVTDSSVVLTAVWIANTLSAPAITSADVANGGTMETAGATINITADSGTDIYYTLDGTDPTTDSTRYTAPFSATGMSVRIRAIAVKDNHFDSPVAAFSFTRKPYSAAECLNTEGTVATSGSDVAWGRVLGEAAHDGVAAMRSGVIGDSGTSSIEMTVEGTGEIGFWWKSSSEISRNRKYDYVSFLIDGEEQSWLGGEKDWTNEVFTVSGSGTHTLKWVYQKNDNGQTQGEDCAWLDEVTWIPGGYVVDASVTGGNAIRVNEEWVTSELDERFGAGKRDAFVAKFGSDIAAALTKKTGKFDGAGNELAVWHDYVAGTDPTDTTSTFKAKIEICDGVPVIEWEPNLNEGGEVRTYTIYGMADLKDEWHSPTNALDRFFKVDVAMPVDGTVTFNVGGGAVIDPMVVRVGQPIGTLPTPTRQGYDFLGWFTEAEGGTAITPETTVTDDLTIYAHWERKIAPDLVHRWSFNGDLTDSVGGQTAAKVGSVTAGATQYTLAGGASGSSYINLGANVLPNDGSPVTLEMWVTQHSYQNYARIWDFGNTKDEDMYMGLFSTDSDRDAIVFRNSGVVVESSLLAPYTAGTEFYIAVVMTPLNNGRWKLDFYKKNSSGTTLRSYSATTTASSWTLQGLTQSKCYLGHAIGDAYDANASYNEFRVWKKAMTGSELTASAIAGPDANL